MLDFFIKYWRLILEIVIMVISLIMFLCRKKPVNSVTTDIYMICIKCIEEVEATCHASSKEKLAVCINKVIENLRLLYPSLDTRKYINFITGIIEDILATPQKKEV